MFSQGNLIKNIFTSDNQSELMSKLKKYTRDGSYLSHIDAKKRIRLYIDCGCDYKKTLEAVGGNEKNLRSAVNYANDALKNKVGSDIVELIERGDSMADVIVDSAIGDTKTPVLGEVWSGIPKYNYKSFNLNDCVNELRFIFLFSVATEEYCKNKVDREKLSYIRHLLTEPSDIERRDALLLKKYVNRPANMIKHDVRNLLAEINEVQN